MQVCYNKNFFKCYSVVIIGKYVKIRFKNRGSPYYCLSSKVQKIKNIKEIEQKRRWFHLFRGVSHAKTDLPLCFLFVLALF